MSVLLLYKMHTKGVLPGGHLVQSRPFSGIYLLILACMLQRADSDILLLLYAMERVGWERLDVVGATRVLQRGSSTRGMDSAHMQ